MALIQVTYVSQALKRSVPLQVILPVDAMKPSSGKPFQTLYLLHGLLGSSMDWLVQTRINRLAETKNLAVVMPSGENTYYIPQPNPHNDFGAYIGEELVEITRRMFPLSHRREDTFIAGLSMGGFGAIRNGLKYHETFGCIAGLSSSVHFFEGPERKEIKHQFDPPSCFGDLARARYSDKNPRTLIEKLGREKDSFKPKIYLACGTEDTLLPANRIYRDCFTQNGFDLTYEEFPGGHTWEFWDMGIERVLNWLPLEESTAR